MTSTTEDCCAAWVAIRPHLKWYSFVDDPGVYTMPSIPESGYRVNYCPSCGAVRRSSIWNSNTHPIEEE
jgi:hypothetical protein